MNDQKSLWDKAHSEGQIHHYSKTPTDFALKVLSLIPSGSKVLELGCGVGNDSIAFAEAEHKILATDLSEVAVLQNSQRFNEVPNLKFKTLDINQPFQMEENSYDVVYARLSLHYFKDSVTRRIFNDIYNVLKPGGILCFMCKSTNDALYGKGDKIEDDMFENEGHVRHFFSKDYAKKCLENTFKIIEIEEKTELLYGKSSSFIEAIAQKP